MKIDELKFDDKNFNKHTEFGMGLLEKSLRENGAGRSILIDKDNNIIAGNGIIEAAGSVGLENIKVLIVAVTSAAVSVVLGTLGAIGTFYLKKRSKKAVEILTQIPIANAEIVIALSLTVMFVFIGTYIFRGAHLFSYWTLLIGHVVLSIPFVYLSVKPKLQQMDPNLYEAALDLGATPSQGLRKVIIPQIMPGVFSGFLLSITLSLDDYIVTEFTRGAGLLSGDAAIETLSTYIQTSLKKHTVPAELRPLTLIIFLTILSIVIGITIYRTSQAKREAKRRAL